MNDQESVYDQDSWYQEQYKKKGKAEGRNVGISEEGIMQIGFSTAAMSIRNGEYSPCLREKAKKWQESSEKNVNVSISVFVCGCN